MAEKKRKFTKYETRLIAGMSLLMAIRMLGISMIIPLLSIFATNLDDATILLAGVAVGIFGFSQTLMLIPMGKLSDRWGRKQTTLLGLGIYFTGTILSGLSANIYHLIISRLIAGAGAVSGVTMAWVTEGIRAGKRNSALAYVGMSIGLSVIAGFTLSPIITEISGAPFLFFICAGMILVAMAYTIFFLKNHNSISSPEYSDTEKNKSSLLHLMRNRDLMRLNLTVMINNIALSAFFFTMPLLIKGKIQIIEMSKLYAPMAIIGTCLMFYFSNRADREGTVKTGAIAVIFEISAACIAVFSNNIYALFASFILLYSGNCILSPLLPAAVSRYPDERIKGKVMSLFNASMSTGSGIGGMAGGIMHKYAPSYLFPALAVLLGFALFLILRFKNYQGKNETPGSPISI